MVGSFLYYGRAINNTILAAINEIPMKQFASTAITKEKTSMLMDCLSTHPEAMIRFHASKMKLFVESDAAYLVAPEAKSRIAGYYHMGPLFTPFVEPSKPNAPVHIECRVLKPVVSSAAEAETAGIFQNSCTALDLKNMLEALGHPQGPIDIKTDNSTAVSFSNGELKAKRSKSWDMRLHWIRDRIAQQQLRVTWGKGSENLADYFTKHFPPSYHQRVRTKYILQGH